jgi:hypothetical protein
MEEFIFQESKRLFTNLVNGESIIWPCECRNCNYTYPTSLKNTIEKTILERGFNGDLLSVVSSTLRSINPKINYCCINNFRPIYNANETSKRIFIEEGLIEWYDVRWDDDDDAEEEMNEVSISIHPRNEFSLFDIKD